MTPEDAVAADIGSGVQQDFRQEATMTARRHVTRAAPQPDALATSL
jgi:hypothetical protein